MRRIFSIFLCLIVFVFCGCGKKDDNKIRLKFSSWGSQSEIAIIKPLLKEFETQNPDIKVEFIHVPQNYFQKIHLLFASNLAPDVVFLNNFYSQKYIKAGLLEDLTPYFDMSDFFEKAIVSSSYKGRLYLVPRDVSVPVVYYNKEIFRKYGVPFPDENWTINDYAETAKKLTQDTNNDGKTDIWGTGFEKEPMFWLPFLFSNNGGLLDESGKKLIMDMPQSIASLNTYADILNRYHAAPSPSQTSNLTMAQLFLQGKLAMQISGRWLVPKYRKDMKYDWDIVNFPHGTAGSVVGVDSSGYAVSKSSKHKEEALRLMKFLSSESSCEKLTQSGLIIPARKSIAFSETFLAPKEKPHNSHAYLYAAENGKPTPVNENYQEITDKTARVLEPLFLGKLRAEDLDFSVFN